mgnify:FL=1|jgi:hypothetical protein
MSFYVFGKWKGDKIKVKRYMSNRKWMRFLFVTITLFFMSIHVSAQHLYIYGGDDHNIYLGCLTSSPYDSNSIWNEYGSYGNEYNPKSIWNEYGTYGSEYGSYSPWNEYASNPPVIVDKKGNFYGYFTVNEYKSERAEFKLVLLIYKYHELMKGNLQKWYNELF